MLHIREHVEGNGLAFVYHPWRYDSRAERGVNPQVEVIHARILVVMDQNASNFLIEVVIVDALVQLFMLQELLPKNLSRLFSI